MVRIAIFAAGIILGVLTAMKLTWSREPVEPAWREDDDGIQPADPWPAKVLVSTYTSSRWSRDLT